MKTILEIDKLKRDWESDPSWDIETTDGFEEHREELKQFRIEAQNKWKNKEMCRKLALAQKLHFPGNIAIVNHLEGLLFRIELLESEVAKLKGL